MGDEKLIPFIYKQLARVMLALVVILAASWVLAPRAEPETKFESNPKFDKTILIVTATPVDNEPGVYILEYSNGVIEVLHADGTREPLKTEGKRCTIRTT